MPKTGFPRSHRPPVRLSVPRIEGNRLTALQHVYLNRVMVHHDQPNRDTLSYACLDCGSVGESATQDARDLNAKHIDLTCCNPATTVLFRTERI